MSRLVVISNRVVAPSVKSKGASGGLASALHAALKRYSGIWFGWSGDVVDVSDGRIETEEIGGVTIATINLDQDDYDEYYNGFANSTLWPLFHYRIDLTAYDRSYDQGFYRVNSKFAHSVRPLIDRDDLIWVHDYHMIPIGEELRGMGVKNRMGFFLHIPWPARQVLATLPKHEALVRALFAYDLVGFHTEDFVDAFIDYVIKEAGGTLNEDGTVTCFGRTTRVAAFPIGIDAEEFREMTTSPEGQRMYDRMEKSLGDRRMIIGVDRLDYSKGLASRVRAYGQLLHTYPEHRGQVSLLQISPTSRGEVTQYQALRDELEFLTGRLNGQYADVDWMPVRYVNRGYRRASLAGLFRLASVGFVTPLRDGMNLVAKEFVAAQDEEDPGVLVLSRFAGAADQLRDALIINPYDEADMVEALRRALHMPVEERRERWQSMYENVRTEDVFTWRDSFVSMLTGS